MAPSIVSRDARKAPYRYNWDTFAQSGVDNFSAQQNPEMFEVLTNVMPIVDGSIDRRWGYRLWYDPANTHKQIFSYRNENANQQLLVGTGNSFTAVYTEEGSLFRSSLFTPVGNSREPRMVNSRSYGFFADGSPSDYQKWNGADVGGVTQWGVDVNDTSATETEGPNLADVAADQGASGSSGSAGPSFTGTGATESDVPSYTWSSASTITTATSGTTGATCPTGSFMNPGETTSYLDATNFGFAIPSGATIVGVQVSGRAGTGNTTERFATAKASLIKGGSHTGSESTQAVTLPTVDVPGDDPAWAGFGMGGPTSMFGATLTPSDVNASNFGVAIRFTNAEAVKQLKVIVDYVKIAVYYTVPSTTSWTSPNNILLDDAAEATATVSTSPISELRATDFDFTIAATAAIAGIEVQIDISSIGGLMNIAPILVKGSSAYGTRKSSEVGATGVVTFGGPTDLWGGNFSPSDINATTFGAQFYAQTTSGTYALGVDALKITVYAVTGPITLSATAAGNITLSTGRKYAISFKSAAGEYSDISPASASTGALAAKQQPIASIPVSNDTQVDKVAILATADGGDETLWYLITELNDGTTTYTDDMPEATLLEQPVLASTDDGGNEFGVFDNSPPPIGAYNPVKHRGRIYMHDGNYLYWSKSLPELVTSSAFVAGLWESCWPVGNRMDVTEGAESIRGILSDGYNLYVATQFKIKRFSGDAPFLEPPDIVHNEAGLLNIDSWKIVFREGAPSGAIWLTPDHRVMSSDFNTYQDIGTPIQATLNSINNPDAVTYARAVSFSSGPYDFFALAIPTGVNTYSNTICIFNLRSGRWVLWTPADTATTLYSGITEDNEAQLLLATSDAAKIYAFESSSTQDRVDDTPVAITAVLRTSWLDLGDETLRKALNEIAVLTGDGSMTVTVEGASNHEQFNAPNVVLSDRQVKAGPFGEYKVFTAASPSKDRWYRLTLTSTTSQNILDGLNIEAVPMHRL